jgi:hypothetical protein
MIKQFAICLLLGLTFSLPSVAAAPICKLVSTEQLAALQFVPVGEPAESSMDVPADQVGAPSDLSVTICFFYAGKRGGRDTFSITVENFVDGKGLVEWLAGKNSEAKTDGSTLTSLGDATCEQGRYQIDRPKPGESAQEYTQTYISCDRLVGKRRVSLSFEKPLGGGEVPGIAAVKSLLDSVTAALPAPAQ